jgi:hypothetical protein
MVADLVAGGSPKYGVERYRCSGPPPKCGKLERHLHQRCKQHEFFGKAEMLGEQNFTQIDRAGECTVLEAASSLCGNHTEIVRSLKEANMAGEP